jgi:hypothetical protein
MDTAPQKNAATRNRAHGPNNPLIPDETLRFAPLQGTRRDLPPALAAPQKPANARPCVTLCGDIRRV